MNRNQHSIASNYIKICWLNRKLILFALTLSIITGIILGLFSNKNYYAESTLTIVRPAHLNPFLQDRYSSSAVKNHSEAITSILHSHQVLQRIAKESGLLSEDMTQADKDDLYATLVKSLSATLIGTDIIKIKFNGHDKSIIIPALKASSKIMRIYLQPALAQLGTNGLRASNELSVVNGQIARKSAELANAQARYSPQHSEIKSLKNQLNTLQIKRNQLILFSPALAKSNTGGAKNTTIPISTNYGNPSFKDISVRVLSTDSYPETSQPLSVYLMFYVVGCIGFCILIIIGLVLLAELFDSSIQRRQQLKTITDKPVIARLPKYSSI